MEFRFSALVQKEEQWKELCSFLDVVWENLAICLDILPREISKYREIMLHDPKFSPSRQILESWQVTPDASIRFFLDILKQINHWDAIMLIHNWIQQQLPLCHPLRKSLHASVCQTKSNDNNSQDIKEWLKILSLESLEDKLHNIGVETIEDLKLLIAEIADNSSTSINKPLQNTNFTLMPGEKEYQQGIDLGCRFMLALPFFEKSADLDYPPAFLMLHYLYTSELYIVPYDETKSLRCRQNVVIHNQWFLDLAKTTIPTSQYLLGRYYWVRGDYQLASEWYHKAALQDYAPAQHELGRCYSTAKGVHLNHESALIWLQKAANQGHAVAQRDLANYYDKGIGITQNHKDAIYWWQKSASQGFTVAQWELGHCFRKYEDIKNLNACISWITTASDQGFVPAQLDLAKIQEHSGNYEEAAKYYKKAMDQNVITGQQGYERVLKLMSLPKS